MMGAVHEESLRLEGLLGVPPLIRVNGKRPLDREWTTGPREHASEWRRRLRTHEGNAGLVTGNGLVVVDADLYHAEAEDSLDRLYDLGLSRETITVITGGGGRHLYYRTDEPIGSGPLAGFPGIDIKGDGGYVVVPPSVHPSGNAYEWEHGWSPGDIEPADLPAGLISVLARSGNTEMGELDERDEEAVNLLLEHFGAHSPHNKGTYIELTRPGKEARLGGSATVGAVGRGVARVWSSNWQGLEAGTHNLTELRRLAGVEPPRVEVPDLRPPAGYRWWQPGDDDHADPVLGEHAYHGPIGEYMAHIATRSEAHPAGVGFTALAYLATWIGRSVVYVGGRGIRHHPSLWGALVGDTASGGKGVSGDVGELLLEAIDPQIVKGHSINGLGSGPGLIDRLRPEEEGKPPREAVVHEHELANVLKVSARESETLSEILRKAYDLKPLGSHTRQYGDRSVEGYFLSAIGSITPTELRSLMTDVSIANGFANRWLLLHTKITRPMPRGDNIEFDEVQRVADSIIDTIGQSLGAEYVITDQLGELWDPFYLERRSGISGEGPIVKSYSSRHPAHAARLASAFAAIEGLHELRLSDIRAAIAWCDYSLNTVRAVFGDSPAGDAGKLLEAIRGAGSEGLSGTDQRDVFGRNLSGDALQEARAELEARHLIHTTEEKTATKPRLRSWAITPTT